MIGLRSSCLEVFYKKGILKKFAKFTGKQLSQNLFYKVAGETGDTLEFSFHVNFVAILYFNFQMTRLILLCIK